MKSTNTCEISESKLKGIKELASDNVLMTAYLILQQAEEIKARLSLELQAARDDRKAQYKEFQEFMAELRDTMDQIRAKHLLAASLLDLIGDRYAGDKKTQKEKGRIRASTKTQTSRISPYRQ